MPWAHYKEVYVCAMEYKNKKKCYCVGKSHVTLTLTLRQPQGMILRVSIRNVRQHHFSVFIYSTLSLQGIRKIKFTGMKTPNCCDKAQILSMVRVK